MLARHLGALEEARERLGQPSHSPDEIWKVALDMARVYAPHREAVSRLRRAAHLLSEAAETLAGTIAAGIADNARDEVKRVLVTMTGRLPRGERDKPRVSAEWYRVLVDLARRRDPKLSLEGAISAVAEELEPDGDEDGRAASRIKQALHRDRRR